MWMWWKKICSAIKRNEHALSGQSACTGATDGDTEASAFVRAVAHRAVAIAGRAKEQRNEASSLMFYYRGYQLIEYVMIHHRPGSSRVYGGRGVSIRDDLYGVVGDQPSMDTAKDWVDRNIAIADRMLEKALA